jgi:cytochrome c oxidase cbb3-type subunit 3
MSDFQSSFWSYWIIVIALGGVIFCIALLVSQMMAKTNKPGETDLQPHIWDGDLQEYNNPMPRWWVWMYALCTISAVVFFFLYPGLGSFKGRMDLVASDYPQGWTSVGQYDNNVATEEAKLAPIYDAYLKTPIPQLAEDKGAMAIGERLFLNNCAQCHGSAATGAKGFPNLTDNDWLYGGWPDAIETTILGGRNGVMDSQAAALKSPAAINDVANYVVSLSSPSHDVVAAARGKEKFTLCASCHMIDGKGALSDTTGAQHAVGAPNLTDRTWLYGGDIKTITETITKGRNNVMPSWECYLGDARVHVLAAYVWQKNRGDDGKVMNPTTAPDYLVQPFKADQELWSKNKADAKAAGKPECSANSVPDRVVAQAKLDAEKAAAEAKPAEDAKK